MSDLIINSNIKYQTFENFGASGAWWAQVIGGWDEQDTKSDLSKRDRISQLLFDKEEGIGINCYRYNLGSGSSRSGRGTYSMDCRRADSFDADFGEYDWSRDENAVYMLKKAVSDGVEEVIFFVNSPPERMTKNGKGHLDKPGRTNLDKKNYEKFAKYCLDCVEHFLAEGIPIKYISPVNEPVWVWTGGQEGCHYNPIQVWQLFRVFCDEMDKRPALKDLKLSGAENGDLRWFNRSFTRLLLDDVKIRKRLDAIDVHSYFLHAPESTLLKKYFGRIAYMKRFRAYMDKHYPGVDIKVSEWCHMQGGRDFGMKSALEQTKVIMEDLTILNAASWQLWIAVSNVDYCDGVIYEFDDSRAYRLTKRYFAYGNFCKFIKPGMKRIEASAGDKLHTVAFENDEKTVIVIANRTKTEQELNLPFDDAEIYITSDRYDLSSQMFTKQLIIPEKSVTTIVVNK